MGKKTPQAPASPDPYATASAQTGANVQSAIASGVIGNINQVGPNGSTKYDQTDTYTMTGADGKTYQVPRYTQTTTLSPEQQQLYNQQTKIGSGMNDLALGQVNRLQDHLGKPIDASKLSPVDNDFSQQGRQRVEDAMFARLSPQMQRAREAEENRLVNQGFQRGTQGYTDAMGDIGRQENDQRLAITERGLAEQQGQFGMQQSARQSGLNEMLALRNQPINEITALMSGGQVSMPQYQQYNAPQIGAADVSGNIYNNAAMANNQWQTQQQAAAQKQAALYGAIGGLGGAGLYGGASGKLGGLFGRG
jgi:hypothetical protein